MLSSITFLTESYSVVRALLSVSNLDNSKSYCLSFNSEFLFLILTSISSLLEISLFYAFENARFFSEESLSRTPEEQSKTLLVRHLSSLIDYYVNDDFDGFYIVDKYC